MGKIAQLAALAGLLLATTQVAAAQVPTQKILESLQKEFKDINKVTKDLADKSKKTKELLDKDPFTNEDKDFEPDPDPDGQPELPSTCKDNDDCAKCFKKPYEDLQNTRVRFEKLRGLYQHTKKGIADAIAFGDVAASANGIAGLAWIKEKEKVRESERGLDAAYDNKYAELIGTLKEALDGISACEEEVFHEEAWYDRYGFIYYQFMADRYRRQ